jgi:hypothetical protein
MHFFQNLFEQVPLSLQVASFFARFLGWLYKLGAQFMGVPAEYPDFLTQILEQFRAILYVQQEIVENDLRCSFRIAPDRDWNQPVSCYSRAV